MNNHGNGASRDTIWKIYDFIQDGLYLSRPDLEIKGRRFNAALLLTLLTALGQGRALIVGEPGLGKTTSAEYVGALLFRLPLGIVWQGEISGHPEQTEEKIIGRPDLGRLNRGEEAVVWSFFTLLPVKIVDEINRLPETKQSLILDGVDRGKWAYLNEAVVNEEFCLFATANYQDRGTNTIIAPLLDRFDVMVESRHPGPNLAYHVGLQDSKAHLLRRPDLEDAFQHALTERLPYPTRAAQLEILCEEFGAFLKKEIGLPTLSRTDRRTLREEKNRIPFDESANAFLRFLLAELAFCYHHGQKRFHESCEEGCHFSGYLCRLVQNCPSNRLPLSLRHFAQTLAWLLGDGRVDLEHLQALLPFALAHRLQWKEEAFSQWPSEIRDDPLAIFMARRAVQEVHRRFQEQAGLVSRALLTAGRILEGEPLEPIRGDHPIYWEIQKDLGLETGEA